MNIARKQVPNSITAFRVLCGLALLWFEPMSAGFLIVHVFGASSDFVDGFVARRWNLSSPSGAFFDSIADAFYVLMLLIAMIPVLTWPSWIIGWLTSVIVLRLVAVGIGCVRFREPVFLHTYLNKIAGALILAVPFLVLPFDSVPVLAVVCVFATISAVEETLIIATSAVLDRDITSIFHTESQFSEGD